MPRYSKKSKDKLATCHPDLQRLANEIIKEIDITILHGHRTPAEQNALYQQGRTKPGKIVTNVDGYNKKSRHNYSPSQAFDFAPWPIDWNDLDRFKAVGDLAKVKAKELGIKITYGGDWGWDWGHIQIELD